MIDKWSNEQVEMLIEAYRDEMCLYALDHPNYHNKHLRSEALKRVCEKVKIARPNTTEKDCLNKFHNMRNQFNVENGKIRASIKSGAGTDDVYKPSLWYFDKLDFLISYINARKGRNSLEKSQLQQDHSQLDSPSPSLIDGSVEIVWEENVIEEAVVDEQPPHSLETIETSHIPSFPTTKAAGCTSASVPFEESSAEDDTPTNVPIHTFPVTALASGVTYTPTVGRATPTAAKSLSSTPANSPTSIGRTSVNSKKRGRSDASEHAEAIKILADAMRQPIKLNTVDSNSNASTSSKPDAVDGFGIFLVETLKSIQNEEVRFQVMNRISQMVLEAKIQDLKVEIK